MQRLELVEREVSFTQNAADRRDGIWHVWTNDAYWHRRLKSVGATLIKEGSGGGADYTLALRQLLVRKVPAPRKQGPRIIDFTRRKVELDERRKAARPQAVPSVDADRGIGEQ